MTTSLRTTNVDAWASEARPPDTHGADPSLLLQQGAGVRKWAFLFASRPWASSKGVTVTSAILRVTLARVAPTAMTLQLARVEQGWTEKNLAWKTRPATVVGVIDATAVVANGAAVGTVVLFDVTAALQAVADGSPYFGFRIIPDPAVVAGVLRLASSEASNASYRPTLEVVWSTPPDQPTDLRPSGSRFVSTRKPTLSWSFGDIVDASAFQSAYEVQISTVADFATTEYGSTKQTSGTSQLNLASTAYAGLPVDGTVRYWRVRVWDDSGEVSEWSEAAAIRYAPLPTVVVTAPGATTSDVRPSVAWTYTPAAVPVGEVATQTAWRAILERKHGVRWDVLADSGLVTGTDASWSPPASITDLAANYRVRVFVSDGLAREAVATFATQATDDQAFTYVPGGAVTNPSSVVATVVDGYAVRLTWSRATPPDHWALVADGYLVHNAIDPIPTGTNYAWTWFGAFPRKAHALKLHAVEIVGGAEVLSSGVAVGVTTSPQGIWLADQETALDVCIAGEEELGAEFAETSAVYERIGELPPVVVTELVRGYAGSISGVLLHWPTGRDPKTSKATLRNLRMNGVDLRLVLGDLNLPVEVYGLIVNPTPDPGDKTFVAGFSFVQSGEFDRT